MEKPVRYGVIGIGGMGANHAKKLQENKIENAILSAVADSNLESVSYTHLTLPTIYSV